MRQKIDVDSLWQTAVRSFTEGARMTHSAKAVMNVTAAIAGSPLTIERFVAQPFNLEAAIADVKHRLEARF